MIKILIFVSIALFLCFVTSAAAHLLSRYKPEIIEFILFADLVIKRKRSQQKGKNKVININNYIKKQAAERLPKTA